MINTIKTEAKKMANSKTKYRWLWDFYISSNPYSNKKQGTVWHNAFYDECKKIGRKVL